MNESDGLVVVFAVLLILIFATVNHCMYLGINNNSLNCNDMSERSVVVKFYEKNVVTISCNEDRTVNTIITPIEE